MPWNPEHYMKKKEVIKILEDNKITNVVPSEKKKICPNCKGNGFTKHSWEAVDQVVQCKACHSEGEIPEERFVHQTYTQKDGKGKESTTNYVGPLLDADLFTDLRIVV